MALEFETGVNYGLELSKRIYYGKEPVPVPPQLQAMLKTPLAPQSSLLPTSVTAYAVVPDPEAVDNTDVPSYQPYVHGRCEPPALVPLKMVGPVGLEVNCWLDQALVTLTASWRVNCIKAGRACACRIAVPLGEQGCILGVEIDLLGRSYHSQIVAPEDVEDQKKLRKGGDGQYLKGCIYTFRIPQVQAGSTIFAKLTWSQKLTYDEGQICLQIPFNFPVYVNPIGKGVSKRERILLNVNSVTDRGILVKSSSHALKEIRHDLGSYGFLYESEVPHWSTADFKFSYMVSVSEIYGTVISQTQFLRDPDDRNMFCLSLFPGNFHKMKAFRKEIVLLIDMSKSMNGAPLGCVKNALLSVLSNLSPPDSFNIIAFNGESYLFSPLMEPATQGSVQKATRWLENNLVADGGTNLLLPLKQALELLPGSTNSMPLIFLITDGSVDDERDICNFVQDSLTKGRSSFTPRICTFAIGNYCNHYFLKMLAQMGRGHFGSSYDADSIDHQLKKLFMVASSIIVANITIDGLDHLPAIELLPSSIPDLSSRNPMIISGRYQGKLPESLKLRGVLSDMSDFTVDVKVRKPKDVSLDRLLARRQIDAETAKAWFSENKDLEQKIAKRSIQTGVPSEYTCMILLATETADKATETVLAKQIYNKANLLWKNETEVPKIIILGCTGVGFGNVSATINNIPPGTEEPKPADASEMLVKAASNCCSQFLDRCWCCMYFIRACSHTTNQCSVVLSQLCAALACFECLECCYDLCPCV